jgi:hypothetical protein
MNGLIDPSVEIGREALEEAVEKAAMSCARGPVQAATVIELIENGFLPVEFVDFRWSHTGTRAQIGAADIAPSSWQGLKTRLQRAGFEVRVEWTVKDKKRAKAYVVRWRTEQKGSVQ